MLGLEFRTWITLGATVGVLFLSAWLAPRASLWWPVLIVGLGAGLLLLRRPGLGLVALAALSFTLPVQFGTGSAVSLTLPVFLIPAVALAWLVDSLGKRSLTIVSSRVLLPLILFLGSGLLSLAAGNIYWDPLVPRPDNLLLVQMGQWAVFVLSALIFVLPALIDRQGVWLRAITFVFLAVGTVLVLEFFLSPLKELLGWSDPRMGNRSLFWVWLSALATGQLLCNRQLRGGVRLWLVVLLLAGTYVVWFRLNDWISGWAPYTVAALIVGWVYVFVRHRGWGLLVGVLLVIVAVAVFPIIFEHAGGEQEMAVSWGGRQQLYQATIQLVKDHPLLGLGPAAYRHYGHMQWLGGSPGAALWLQPNISSHNNYIDIYAQMGLVGLGIFLWFLIELGRVGWRLLPAFEGDFAQGYVFGALGGFGGTLVAMLLADWFLPFVYNIGFHGFRTSALAWMFLGGLVALETIHLGEERADAETA